MMQLIVLTGLPGTGKSSVAEALGRTLAIPVFAKDWLEAVLLRCALQSAPDSAPGIGHAGYELLTTLARRQLQLGQSAILDSMASTETIRAQWRELAASYQARWSGQFERYRRSRPETGSLAERRHRLVAGTAALQAMLLGA